MIVAPVTRGTPRRSRLAYITGVELGLDPIAQEALRIAALLHDVGVLRLPFPHSGSRWHLPPEERRIHETHPEVGAKMIAGVGLPTGVQAAVRGHHERWDGTGYPSGQRGMRVPLEARIIGVCDAYESLLNGSRVAGWEPRTHEEASCHLKHDERERYDQDVVDALLGAVGLGRELGALTGALA